MRKNTKTTNATAIAISAAIGSFDSDNARAATFDSASDHNLNHLAPLNGDAGGRADLVVDAQPVVNAGDVPTVNDQSQFDRAPVTDSLRVDIDPSNDGLPPALTHFEAGRDHHDTMDHAGGDEISTDYDHFDLAASPYGGHPFESPPRKDADASDSSPLSAKSEKGA